MNGPMAAAGSPQFLADQRPVFENKILKRKKRKKRKKK